MCTIINSRQFSCDCQHTGYEGELCEKGIVALPDFPKLTSDNPSEILVLQAKPDNSLAINFNPTTNLTVQPKTLTVKHPASKAEFQVTGHKPGFGMMTYDLEGMNKYDFSVPENSFLFIGRNISTQNSVYTRIGLLVGELPMGCQTKEIQNDLACKIRVVFDSNSSMSEGFVIETGPVHIIASDNKTVPLSLVGYNFSLPLPSRGEIMERIVKYAGDQELSAHGCSDLRLTVEDLMEFVQKDALSKSFMSYLSDQLPMWLNVKVGENSDLFDIRNTMASLVEAKEAHILHPICKFPIGSNSAVVLYRPLLNYSIFLENEHLSLSSKGLCFVTDICQTGVFLTLSHQATKKVQTLQLMQDMADGGWKVLVASFGFTAPRRYSKTLTDVPNGHLAEDFSDFRYNFWMQGSANIHLSNSSNSGVDVKMTGEAFAFADDLNTVSIFFLAVEMNYGMVLPSV